MIITWVIYALLGLFIFLVLVALPVAIAVQAGRSIVRELEDEEGWNGQ